MKKILNVSKGHTNKFGNVYPWFLRSLWDLILDDLFATFFVWRNQRIFTDVTLQLLSVQIWFSLQNISLSLKDNKIQSKTNILNHIHQKPLAGHYQDSVP